MKTESDKRRELCKKIELVIQEHYGCSEPPSMILNFMLPPEYTQAQFFSNVERASAIRILRETTVALERGLN